VLGGCPVSAAPGTRNEGHPPQAAACLPLSQGGIKHFHSLSYRPQGEYNFEKAACFSLQGCVVSVRDNPPLHPSGGGELKLPRRWVPSCSQGTSPCPFKKGITEVLSPWCI